MIFLRTKLALSTLAMLPILGVVASADSMGIVNYEFVNIRINPSVNDSVKFVLKKGDKVQILSEKDGWINIKSNNKDGWVQSSAISKINEVSNIKSAPRSINMVVNNDSLNLRTAPSTNGKIIAVLKKGDKVKVLEETVGWSKVDCNGKVGYVSTKFLVPDGSANKSKSMTVTSNNLNARKTTSISSEKVFTLKKGDKVEFVSESNGWSQIKFDGKVGYVSSYYLEEGIDDIEENPDNNGNNPDTPDVEENENPDKTSPDGTVNYVNMGMSLSKFVDLQMSTSLNVNSAGGWKPATKDELTNYMNPNNFTDDAGMMQFAELNRYTEDLTVDQLNQYLNKMCKPGNVFHNQGASFINAAKKNNVNVLYLVAHSMLETGNGTSTLAKGVMYNGKKVYNFFGIGAVDGNAVNGGAATAYKNGWTTVVAGLDGAANWISTKYIHNDQYKQYTLYSMKWSKDVIWHQYATDIAWPSKIGNKMHDISKYSTNLHAINYLVPQYQ